MRKKVVHVIWTAALGGIERVTYSLIQEQLRSGDFAPELFVAKHEGSTPDHYAQLGIPFHVGGFKKGFDRSASVRKACRAAFSGADIVHIHSFNPFVAQAAIKSGAKVVFTEHGNFAFQRKRGIGERISLFLMKRFLNRDADLITFNSHFSRTTAESRYGLQLVHKEVVYNGCPPLPDPLPNWNEIGLNKEKIRIASIGRLVEVKMFDRLLRSLAKANNPHIQLIITGDGPLKNSLQLQAQQLGIAGQVLFTGTQPALAVLNSCDLCVFPSRFEAFGLVAVEAWQLGKAVAVFADGGGLAETTGALEPSLVMQNEDQLAEWLNKLNDQLPLLQGMEMQLKRKAYSARFSTAAMAEHFNELYLSL